jgi:hypothetical protein
MIRNNRINRLNNKLFQINVRENREEIQEWTIQRHGQHWTQDTQR